MQVVNARLHRIEGVEIWLQVGKLVPELCSCGYRELA